jgi:predicted RNase H-like nuclease (RuvC/YqgF family)
MFYPDGSASVHVTVSINELKRSMWLPVMDFKNNAIANPNSRQISDAKMRCLVKCIAMFGLAHYVFAGEDLPPSSDDEEETEQPEQPEQAEQAEEETKETEEELPVNYKKFSESLIETATKMEETVSGLESLWKSNKETIKELKTKDEELYQKLVRSFAERRSQMENATEEVATEKGDKEDD